MVENLYLRKVLRVILTHSQDLSSSHPKTLTDPQARPHFRPHPCLCSWVRLQRGPFPAPSLPGQCLLLLQGPARSPLLEAIAALPARTGLSLLLSHVSLTFSLGSLCLGLALCLPQFSRLRAVTLSYLFISLSPGISPGPGTQ